MSNLGQRRLKMQEKFKHKEGKVNQIDNNSKATSEKYPQIIKFITLLQQSQIIQEEIKKNGILDKLQPKFQEIQKKNQNDDTIDLTFSGLLNNKEAELKSEEISNLFKLIYLFKIDTLKGSLQNYIRKHLNDVEFIFDLKISQESKEENENMSSEDDFSVEIEKVLSENIIYCLASEQLSKIWFHQLFFNNKNNSQF